MSHPADERVIQRSLLSHYTAEENR